MSEYIVIPYIQVQAANFQNNGLLMGGAPLFAASMFSHALARALKTQDIGFHYVHHNIQPLGAEAYGRFTPAQRRGAVFIGKNDYSSKNKYALSLQPSASCHLLFSLVIHVKNSRIQFEKINKFLAKGRFAGGQILKHNTIQSFKSLSTALQHIGAGFLILDRKDLLLRYQEKYNVKNRLDAFTQLLAYKAEKKVDDEKDRIPVLRKMPEENLNWISATTLGYTLIEPLNTERTGVRHASEQDQTAHAFAEPLTGLIQYYPLNEILNDFALEDHHRKWRDLAVLEWSYKWISEETFLLQQSYI